MVSCLFHSIRLTVLRKVSDQIVDEVFLCLVAILPVAFDDTGDVGTCFYLLVQRHQVLVVLLPKEQNVLTVSEEKKQNKKINNSLTDVDERNLHLTCCH